ncbi:hypothetical protein [Streptomyces sp. NPDC092370]|uniref:hypothetical protein n=1 Tax=Streptomyces sp. NPDC092370 TaxID=3366016 RepID=UPI0037FA7D9C
MPVSLPEFSMPNPSIDLSWVDWGSAPAWVAGVFAGVAAYGAWATLRSQKREAREQREFIAKQADVLALQHEQLSAFLLERRWEQARKVDLNYRYFAGVAGTNGSNVHVEVGNHSPAELHAVTAQYGPHWMSKVDVRRIDGSRESLSAPVFLAPFEVAEFIIYDVPMLLDPHAYFTDSAGQRWHLTTNEHLRPVEPEAGMGGEG